VARLRTGPDDFFNDVVALAEGGFLVTRFGPKSEAALLWARS
jgi:archaellum component FlaD/FlaE